MPRIRFTADPKLPRDLAHLAYRRDMEVDLPRDQADRWIRRGVATEIAPKSTGKGGKDRAAAINSAAPAAIAPASGEAPPAPAAEPAQSPAPLLGHATSTGS